MYTHFRAPAARSKVLMIGGRLRVLPTSLEVELEIKPAEEVFNGFDHSKYALIHVNADDMRHMGMSWTTRLAEVIRQKRATYVVYNATLAEQCELRSTSVHFTCFLADDSRLYAELLSNR